MAKDFYYTICLFLCAAVLALRSPVFADCGQPHESTGTNTTDSGSSSTDSGATGGSSIKTPAGDVGSTTGGQLGATFDPSAQGGGGKDPDQLTLQHLKNFKVEPGMWRSYVKYIQEMSDLLKAREKAKINEYVRKAAWARQSGLEHAEERYREAQKKALEAYKNYWAAEGKASNALSASQRAEERHRYLERVSQNGPTLEMREAAKREMGELEKNAKSLEEAYHSAWEERGKAQDKFEALNKVEWQRFEDVKPALERYQNMEAHYNDAINTPIPQPSESGR